MLSLNNSSFSIYVQGHNMKKKLLTLLTFLACLSNTLLAQEDRDILVNNRVLYIVNDKAITVMDIKKKLDLFFYREFPDYANSVNARYQFYTKNWRSVFNDLVNRELIIADAHEKKMPVTDRDIREEMDGTFGPKPLETIDQLGMTYEDAWKHVKEDITVHRMMLYMVNFKARDRVTPSLIQETYDRVIKGDDFPNEWLYRVVTFQDSNPDNAKRAARHIYDFLTQGDTLNFDTLDMQLDKLKGTDLTLENTQMNVSGEFSHKDADISPAFKNVLHTLRPGYYSLPIAQQSRSSGQQVYRIFYLDSRKKAAIPSFEEIEDQLKDRLLQQAMVEETMKYIQKLREHFHIKESDINERLSPEFTPFSLS